MNPLIQTVSTMNEPHKPKPGAGRASMFYDVLFVTGDPAIWNDYSLFFKYEHPAFRIAQIPDAGKLKPVLRRLAPDGVLLLDMRHSHSNHHLSQAAFWDAIRDKTAVFGLTDSDHFPAALTGRPAVRLDGVIAAGLPAIDNWARIEQTRSALQKPLMSVRIENVAVTDILQLLTMNERSSNVIVRGQSKPDAPTTEGRLLFQKGILELAVTSRQTGDQAVMDILRLRQGTIEVFTSPWMVETPNIHVSLDKLLLDYAVGFDESQTQEDLAPVVAEPEVAELIDSAQASAAEELETALTAGTWGLSTERDIPERFQGVHPFQVFRSRWSEMPPETVDRLEHMEEGQLPMDWLTPKELAAELDRRPGQRVLILRGSLEYLICLMASWHESFHVDRLCDGRRPVIRIGEGEQDSVWFVGDLEDRPLDLLNDYPCAIWTEPREADPTLRRTAALGHPAVVLMTSDIKLYTLSINWGLAYEGPVGVPHDCIVAQADSWLHVRRALTSTLKILKGMAARCK